jgi:hypothetical protein
LGGAAAVADGGRGVLAGAAAELFAAAAHGRFLRERHVIHVHGVLELKLPIAAEQIFVDTAAK